MISLGPFILAAEIVQQVVAIVLAGIVIVEMTKHRSSAEPHVSRNMLLLLTVIIITTISSVLDYFIAEPSAMFCMVVYIPIAVTVIALMWVAVRATHTVEVRRFFTLLVIVEGSTIAACCLHMIYGVEGIDFDTIRTIANVAETFVLYPLVLYYCIQVPKK